MNAEYSVEECLRLANACVTRGQTVDLSAVSLYLTAYAERIEADESAVPVGYVEIADGSFAPKGALYGQLDQTCRLSRLDQLFTYPPTRAAQVDKHCPECGTHEIEFVRICHNSSCITYAKELTFYEGWKTAEPAAQGDLIEAVNNYLDDSTLDSHMNLIDARNRTITHPHSPDAADSGRVVDDRLHSDSAEDVAQWLYANGHHDAAATVRNQLDVRNTRIRSLEAALAGQGRGEVVAWQYRRVDDEEGPAPYWHDMTRQQYEMFRDSPRSNCEIRQLYDRPAPTASPAGVPDGWADVYAAFKGAFDTPAAWLKDNSEYANDARKRLREFNEAMLAAAPSATPEGGEVGL